RRACFYQNGPVFVHPRYFCLCQFSEQHGNYHAHEEHDTHISCLGCFLPVGISEKDKVYPASGKNSVYEATVGGQGQKGKRAGSMKPKQAVLTLSLDFELHWGRFDRSPLEGNEDYYLKTRGAIPALLRL